MEYVSISFKQNESCFLTLLDALAAKLRLFLMQLQTQAEI